MFLSKKQFCFFLFFNVIFRFIERILSFTKEIYIPPPGIHDTKTKSFKESKYNIEEWEHNKIVFLNKHIGN